jgi:radical SAM superfamily enzyme YgiQ (UPF0313 family)
MARFFYGRFLQNKLCYSAGMISPHTKEKMIQTIDLQVGRDRQQHPIEQVSSQKKAEVVLIRPPLMFAEGAIGNEIVPSIGLAYLNGYLRQYDYTPVLIDGQGDGHNRVRPLKAYPGYQIQGLSFEEIFEQIPSHVQVFGISAMFSAEWPLTRDLINELKRRYPQAITVAGGEHITATTEYSLRDCEGLDYCLCGEGEHIFFELCEQVSTGQLPNGIPGLAYLDSENNYVFEQSLSRIRNIDAIPWPYWPEGYLEKFWQSGKSFGVQTERDMPLLLTRGCPYQCTFCSNKDMWTTRYIMRDIDDIIAEVKFYYEKYQVTSFQIYDLTAITKRTWFIKLLRRLIELNLPVEWSFPSGTRSEILDEELLGLLKQLGTSYLCYAPESGSERTLVAIKKRIDLDAVIKSIQAAARIGLGTRANFIIGFPGETRLDVYKTCWTALKCVFYGVDDLQPYLFNPYPGSALFQDSVDRGEITLGDEYYLSISKQNSDILNFTPVTFNQQIPNWELAIYRLLMTMVCYGVSYLVRPSRIIRSYRNIKSGGRADTVLEARLKGILARKPDGNQPGQ